MWILIEFMPLYRKELPNYPREGLYTGPNCLCKFPHTSLHSSETGFDLGSAVQYLAKDYHG